MGNQVDGLYQLLSYVQKLAGLTERFVSSIKSYERLAYTKEDLTHREGITFNVVSHDEPVWIQVERLPNIAPPEPDEIIREWLEIDDDPTIEPTIREHRIQQVDKKVADKLVNKGVVDKDDVLNPPAHVDPNKVDVRLRLDRLDDIQANIADYLDEWYEWAEEEKPRRQTMAVYNKLFHLAREARAAGGDSSQEVVMGAGMLLWKTEKIETAHPLIEFLIDIEIDPTTHVINVRPRQIHPMLFIKPLIEMDHPMASDIWRKFTEAVKEAEEEDCLDLWTPFSPDKFEHVLRYVVSNISDQAVYSPEHLSGAERPELPSPSDTPIVTNSWAIYARPRSSNFVVQDIQNLLNELQDLQEISPIAQALVTKPEDSKTLHEGLSMNLGVLSEVDAQTCTDINTQSVQTTKDFFLPKAYNDAQLRIIRMLEESTGLVVQGPPGTGKTHTIANIISHYLANGKSVLVTSERAPALDVLRDQIPSEIRPLIVSLLGQDRAGQRQLEEAVAYINNEVISCEPETIEAERIQREREVVHLRGRLQEIETEIKRLAEKQLKKIAWEDKEYTASELARVIVQKREKIAWLEDTIRDEPRFTEEDLNLLRKARQNLGEDIRYIDVQLPQVEALPSVHSLIATHEDIIQAQKLDHSIEDDNKFIMTHRFADSEERASRLLEEIVSFSEFLDGTEKTKWLHRIYHIWLSHGLESKENQLLNNLFDEMKEIVEKREYFMMHPVSVPVETLQDKRFPKALQRALQGKKPLPAVYFGRRAQAQNMLDTIKVDGKMPNTVDGWKRVDQYVTFRESVVTFMSRWDAMSDEYELPHLPPDVSQSLPLIDQVYQKMADARKWIQLGDELITQIGELFFHPYNKQDILGNPEVVRDLRDDLDRNSRRLRFGGNTLMLNQANNLLQKYDSPLIRDMQQFLTNTIGNSNFTYQEIGETWQRYIDQLTHLNKLEPDMHVVREVSEAIRASGALQWAENVRTVPAADGNDPQIPDDWEACWNLRRLSSYLNESGSQQRMREIADERRKLEKRLERAMAEVVKLRTYLGIYSRMTEARLSALHRFTAAMNELGRGTGIRARRLRADARKALSECMDAIPCWVMPTWRVSEALPSELEKFDLIIIDEASQSDVMALPTLLRGKKILIVGDDRQVTPSTIALEERKLLQLRESFLKGQPMGDMVMPGKSLYDLGKAMFPGNVVMLNEHFRCVEPIIRFSFQFYDQEIVPLRIPKPSERLEPPLIDVYVKNGKREPGTRRNIAEAVAIVDEIERLMNDPNYEGRSIGVISLIGAPQAEYIQGMLLERVGEKRFLEHDVVCGDAATFQGSEKDIVFLSMVASPGQARAQTHRMFEQRFNVALSRARDRMYLFRSVRMEDLPNSADLKRRVLEHFHNPMTNVVESPEDIREVFDSDFEFDVYKKMTALGYHVTPQVRVGEYRIDLVIEGLEDRRLAVELDGDGFHGPDRWLADWNRQKNLERVGWHFWRCWASTYYTDPEGTIAELIKTLDEMGIEPIQAEERRLEFVEYREIGVNDVISVEKTPRSQGEIEQQDDANQSDTATIVENGHMLPAQSAEIDSNLLQKTQIKKIKQSDTETETVQENEDDEKKQLLEGALQEEVTIAFHDNPDRTYTITFSKEPTDWINGVVCIQEDVGEALALTPIEEEVEIVWQGERRRAIIKSRVWKRYVSTVERERASRRDEWRFAR